MKAGYATDLGLVRNDVAVAIWGLMDAAYVELSEAGSEAETARLKERCATLADVIAAITGLSPEAIRSTTMDRYERSAS